MNTPLAYGFWIGWCGRPDEGRRSRVFLVLLAFLLGLSPLALAVEAKSWRVGVVDGNGGQWQTLEPYLEQRVPGEDFTIVKLAKKDLEQQWKARQVDFLIAYPCQALVSRPWPDKPIPVATVGVHSGNGDGVSRTGVAGVVLVPKSQKNLQDLTQLNGKTVAIVSQDDYAWLIFRHELFSLGLSPEKAGFSVLEAGSGEAILEAIAQGRAEAGVFSSNDLLKLSRQKRIRLADWNVVNRQAILSGLEIPRSTDLYPGMTCFAGTWVPEPVLAQVQKSLLMLPEDAPMFKETCMVSWHLPADPRKLEILFADLGLGEPRRLDEQPGVSGMIQRHPDAVFTIVLATLTLLFLVIVLFFVYRYRNSVRRQQRQDDQAKAGLEVCLDGVMNACCEGIVILDHEGCCIRVNQAAVELLGWSQEEMLETRFESLVHHAHPDGTPYSHGELPDLLACQHGINSGDPHLVLQTKDRGPIHVNYRAYRLKLQWQCLGALVIFSDISAQLREQEENEAALQDFEETFEADQHPSLILERHGVCLEGNQAAAALFGFASPDEFTGRALAEFSAFRQGESQLPAADLLKEYYRRLDTESLVVFPWIFLNATGEEFRGKALLSLDVPPGVDPVIRVSIVPEDGIATPG